MEAADIGRPSRRRYDETNDPATVEDTSFYHSGDVLGRSAVIDDWCNDEVWAIVDQDRRVVYAQRRSATSGTFLRPVSSRSATGHGVPWVHWDPSYAKVGCKVFFSIAVFQLLESVFDSKTPSSVCTIVANPSVFHGLAIQSGPPVEDCQALARSNSQQGADVVDPLAGFGRTPSGGVFGGVEGQGHEDWQGQGQLRKIFDFGEGNDFLNILRERKRREEAAVAVAVERMRMYLATPEGEAELLKESFLMEGSEDPRVSIPICFVVLRKYCAQSTNQAAKGLDIEVVVRAMFDL